ncbi:lipopolysaccharide assembly protein LapA domain-containing protein [Brevibacterium sp.]|uniref:LapA family protein n=1 Tax=Brevibacterium sp. TaxID=1701 RepID=UPI0028119389|nr:lipopolysaccharide assembly protein LapA domain-containing protein [Brevibacterium sp.]
MSTHGNPRDESQTPEELLAETQSVLGGPPAPGEEPTPARADAVENRSSIEQPVPTHRTGEQHPGEQYDDQLAGDQRAAENAKAPGGMSAGMWLSLILGAVILVLLLIFILQNNVPANFQYFGWQFELPLGVAMLFAAIGGIFIAGIVGSVRIFILGRRLKKISKAAGTEHR